VKDKIKNLLKNAGIYYFLQGRYRYILSEIIGIKNKIQYSKYKGPGFKCNICGSSYSKFIPHYPAKEIEKAIIQNKVIAGYGENIYCPSCGSSARQRLVMAAFQSLIDINGKNILHFSPEKLVFDFLKKHANVVSADIEPGFYKIIDPKIKFSDATKLPFQDEEFDIVIANHVLEHIPDDRKAMAEFYRVLKKNGLAILQVPFSTTIPSSLEQPDINDPKMQEELFGQNDHVRIYQLSDYVNRLRHTGFKVEIIESEKLKTDESFVFQEYEEFILIRK
jgi:SAM-dependent methyltransferase